MLENVMTGSATTTQAEQPHDNNHEQRPRRITTTTHTEMQQNTKKDTMKMIKKKISKNEERRQRIASILRYIRGLKITTSSSVVVVRGVWLLFCTVVVDVLESFGRVFDHLSADSSRVGRLFLFSGVVEFLHRERLHCLLVLFVFVFVFVQLFVDFCERIRNFLSVEFDVAGSVSHVRHKDFLSSGRRSTLSTRAGAQHRHRNTDPFVQHPSCTTSVTSYRGTVHTATHKTLRTATNIGAHGR